MEREYVGIDLHRRRSVIVRKNASGELIAKTHIDNSPLALAEAVAAAGPEPEVSPRQDPLLQTGHSGLVRSPRDGSLEGWPPRPRRESYRRPLPEAYS